MFPKGTATFTQGSKTVSSISMSAGDISAVARGSRLDLGTLTPPANIIEAVDRDISANTITLRDNFNGTTGTYSFIITYTSDGFRDAATAMRDARESLVLLTDTADVNPNPDTFAQRDTNGNVKTGEPIADDDATPYSISRALVRSYAATTELENSRPTQTGQRAENRERANAQYVLAASGYTAQPGDITAANGRVWELQTLEDFRAYGDVGDSVDCGPLIQTVLNSGRSNTYKFRGNFTVDTPSRITQSNIDIDCRGAYFDCSNMYGSDFQNNPDALFELYGSQQSPTTLSSDAIADTSVITVADSSSFSAGNPIYIESDEHWYTEAASIGRVYVGRVARISGNDIYLQHPLPFNFNVSGNAISVYNWTPIKNINVIGGRFYGGNHRRDVGNGRGIGVVYARYFDNVTVDGANVDGFENAAYRMESGVNATVKNCYIQGHTPEFNETIVEGENSGFYGVFFVEVRNAKMLNVDGYRCRHLQDASRTFDMLVENCNGIGCHRPAFGCHSGTYDGTYNECNVEGGAGGLQWRGFHLYVNGGTYNCPDNDSSGIYDAEGGASDLICDRVIKPNRVYSDRSCINVRASFRRCTIEGELQNVNSGFSAVDFTGDYLGEVLVSAYIKQGGGTGIAIRQESSSAARMGVFKITNSTIISDTNLVRMFAPASTGAVWIEGNTFDSSSATFDININNTQTFERLEANFRPDGTPATRN